ncbi:MAG: DNA-directed RNA polymerase subunit RpoH/Rpb5 C-terminal domain-containing protein [Candidatus Heimdallarchaeota archaeon]
MSIDEEVKIKNLLRGIKSILKRRLYKVVKEDTFEQYIDLSCELEEDATSEMFARISLEDKVGVAVLREYSKKLDELHIEKFQKYIGEGIEVKIEDETKKYTWEKIQEEILDEKTHPEKIEKIKTKAYNELKGLLVAANRFTHYARREAKEAGIWIITSKDPRFDIFTHDLVPVHEICTPEESAELLEKYNIKRRQLPKILIGAKPGQIVKIFRESEIAGEILAYRLVIVRTIN